jgi:hypothetical protein
MNPVVNPSCICHTTNHLQHPTTLAVRNDIFGRVFPHYFGIAWLVSTLKNIVQDDMFAMNCVSGHVKWSVYCHTCIWPLDMCIHKTMPHLYDPRARLLRNPFMKTVLASCPCCMCRTHVLSMHALVHSHTRNLSVSSLHTHAKSKTWSRSHMYTKFSTCSQQCICVCRYVSSLFLRPSRGDQAQAH